MSRRSGREQCGFGSERNQASGARWNPRRRQEVTIGRSETALQNNVGIIRARL